jgi:hypothetical protein
MPALALWAFLPIQHGFALPKILAFSIVLLIGAWRARRVMVPHAALALLGWAAICAAWGSWPGLSLLGRVGEHSHGLWAGALYCCLMGLQLERRWLRVAGALLSVHAVLQLMGLDPIMPLPRLPQERAIAWIGSPIDLGNILAMAASLGGWAWLPGLVLTGSRGAWLAAASSLTPYRWRWLALLAVLALPFLPNKKDVARVEMIRIAAAEISRHPITGTGPSTFVLTFVKHKTFRLVAAVGPTYMQGYAHNDLLEVASTMGLVGLTLYLALLWPMRYEPALFALFVAAKFNPVTFDVGAVAALLAARVEMPRVNLRVPALGVACVSIFVSLSLICMELAQINP